MPTHENVEYFLPNDEVCSIISLNTLCIEITNGILRKTEQSRLGMTEEVTKES